MHEDLLKLGDALRSQRKTHRATLKDIAEATGLSRGLLSKIENSRTVPSLPVLMRIARALKISLSELLRSVEVHHEQPYILIKKTEREIIERENNNGYRYENILSAATQDGFLESSILCLNGNAHGELVQTDGYMLVYVLSGNCYVQIDQERVDLNSGDALYFNGRTPHMSRHDGDGEAQIFLIYLLGGEQK